MTGSGIAPKSLADRLEQIRGEMVVTTKCGYCVFRFTGPLSEAREKFDEHDCGRPRPYAPRDSHL